jgi:hypothetical protein
MEMCKETRVVNGRILDYVGSFDFTTKEKVRIAMSNYFQ